MQAVFQGFENREATVPSFSVIAVNISISRTEITGIHLRMKKVVH